MANSMQPPLTPTISKAAINISTIDPGTLRAYHTAKYQVLDANPPFSLCVGQPNPALARLQARHNAISSAYITACNPRSKLLSEAQNTRHQALLGAELAKMGLTFLRGRGVDPTGTWPGEASFLVLGISREAACDLGRRFNQNALLWSGQDATPELVLLF